MPSSQDLLKISDIKDDLIFLDNGSVGMVLKTTAVNFGLLSEDEQMGIIYAFAGLLNSLSHPIQILIRSERLDLSNYLKVLDKAAAQQTNPLLSKMIGRYRLFVTSLIKDNDVLDKQFYICLNVSGVAFGLTSDKADKNLRAATLINPRRDQIIRQLSRVGLKARQLTSEELIKLFYDIYNNTSQPETELISQATPAQTARPATPPPTVIPPLPQPVPGPMPQAPVTRPPIPVTRINAPMAFRPQTSTPAQSWQQPIYPPTMAKLANPYVVEELAE